MTKVLTSAQMRAIEAAEIAAGQVTGLTLMERAGQGVVDAILATWPDFAALPQRAVVLCGPGNNGGDGFVVARLLTDLGWTVEVVLVGDPQKMPPDTRVNHDRWCGMGQVSNALPPQAGASLYLDALFGTGLTRPVQGPALAVLQAFQADAKAAQARLVSVDLPSGICADSGRALNPDSGGAIRADLTVTFEYAKLGHFLGEGAGHTGRLSVTPIGLDPVRTRQVLGAQQGDGAASRLVVRLLDGTDLAPNAAGARSRLDKGFGQASGHKFSHGHAMILSGPAGAGGAARLAARGALRIGAGLVTLGCPPEALSENAARLEAVMLRPVTDAAALASVLTDKRITALCLGPGMGTGAREAGLIAAALRGLRPLVLDADALTILSRHPALFADLHEGCVLTPHAGEFARLFPDIATRLAAPATTGPAFSKADATREAASRAGCIVLYKGADTVIAGPDGRCALSAAVGERAAPWLATAGSGDVLAGFITGLMARGLTPFDAACTGAWLHVECARAFGPGLIAEDLPEVLPKVFRALGL